MRNLTDAVALYTGCHATLLYLANTCAITDTLQFRAPFLTI
jgi:hypothetical protein